LILYPLIHLQILSQIDYIGNFRRPYQGSVFSGNFFLNLWNNFNQNGKIFLESLFFSAKGRVLYAKSFNQPLFIHWITLPIIILSGIISAYFRKPSDIIILTWLIVGSLSAILFVGLVPRYMFIIIIPVVILISRFFMLLFDLIEKNFIKARLSLFSITVLIFTGLISLELYQLISYYSRAPFNMNENIANSYGSKQAAEYLSHIPNIHNDQVETDERMVVFAYLDYFRKIKMKQNRDIMKMLPNKSSDIYYVIWAAESHPLTQWGGIFTTLRSTFKVKYPNALPMKTIYYTNGLPAINLYKITKLNSAIKN